VGDRPTDHNWAARPTTPQFVRHHLTRLGTGDDLTRTARGGTVRPIAP